MSKIITKHHFSSKYPSNTRIEAFLFRTSILGAGGGSILNRRISTLSTQVGPYQRVNKEINFKNILKFINTLQKSNEIYTCTYMYKRA